MEAIFVFFTKIKSADCNFIKTDRVLRRDGICNVVSNTEQGV